MVSGYDHGAHARAAYALDGGFYARTDGIMKSQVALERAARWEALLERIEVVTRHQRNTQDPFARIRVRFDVFEQTAPFGGVQGAGIGKNFGRAKDEERVTSILADERSCVLLLRVERQAAERRWLVRGGDGQAAGNGGSHDGRFERFAGHAPGGRRVARIFHGDIRVGQGVCQEPSFRPPWPSRWIEQESF